MIYSHFFKFHYKKASQNAQQLLNELNIDPELAKACISITENENIYKELTTEQQLVIFSLYDGFKSFGLHKSDSVRNQIVTLDAEIFTEIVETERLMYSSSIFSQKSKILRKFSGIISKRNEKAMLLDQKSIGDVEMSRHHQFQNPQSAIDFLENFRDQHLIHGYISSFNRSQSVNIDEVFYYSLLLHQFLKLINIF